MGEQTFSQERSAILGKAAETAVNHALKPVAPGEKEADVYRRFGRAAMLTREAQGQGERLIELIDPAAGRMAVEDIFRKGGDPKLRQKMVKRVMERLSPRDPEAREFWRAVAGLDKPVSFWAWTENPLSSGGGGWEKRTVGESTGITPEIGVREVRLAEPDAMLDQRDVLWQKGGKGVFMLENRVFDARELRAAMAGDVPGVPGPAWGWLGAETITCFVKPTNANLDTWPVAMIMDLRQYMAVMGRVYSASWMPGAPLPDFSPNAVKSPGNPVAIATPALERADGVSTETHGLTITHGKAADRDSSSSRGEEALALSQTTIEKGNERQRGVYVVAGGDKASQIGDKPAINAICARLGLNFGNLLRQENLTDPVGLLTRVFKEATEGMEGKIDGLAVVFVLGNNAYTFTDGSGRVYAYRAETNRTEAVASGSSIALGDGNRIVICGSGLSGMVESGEMVEIVGGAGDAQTASEKLVGAARGKKSKGDISVISVFATGKGSLNP
ncbi:MAG: hypothetical protein Q8N98_01420 [bacterium]|nr:hypothetical protein [bacterium]